MSLEVVLFAKTLVVLGVIIASAAAVIALIGMLYVLVEAAYQLLKTRW